MGNPTIIKNTISNNTSAAFGGGINLSPFSGPFYDTTIVHSNRVSNNTSASFGGGIYISSSSFGSGSDTSNIIIVSNNTFTNNNATAPTAGGGAIYCNLVAKPTFTNNTIANNKATRGGGLYCDNSCPIFHNCILQGNTDSIGGPQVFLYDEPSDPSFYYCNIDGGSNAFELNGNFYTGTYQNNIDTNALFVSPSGGSGTGFNGITADWSLQAGSRCIDTGDPSGAYPATDIAGNLRVSNGIIDIGAYEFQMATGIENKNIAGVNFYPNPSSGKFTFQSTNENISLIEICNLLGEKIYTQNVNQQPLNEIDLSGSPKGIYFVNMYNGKKNLTKKIVLQ